MFYFGGRFTVARTAAYEVELRCGKCQAVSSGGVAAMGSGVGHSPYGRDDEGAKERAAVDADRELVDDAIRVIRGVACPACGAVDRSATRAYLKSQVLPFVIGAVLLELFAIMMIVSIEPIWSGVAVAVLTAFLAAVSISVRLRYVRGMSGRARLALGRLPAGERALIGEHASSGVRIYGAAPAKAPEATDEANDSYGSGSDDERSARGGAALRAGDYTTAKNELMSVRMPDRRRDYANLLQLVQRLFADGREDDAYQVCTYVFRHFAEVAASNETLAKTIRTLERTKRPMRSLLPKRSRNREILIGAGIFAVFVVAVLVADQWLRTQRTLFISNGCVNDATVILAGQETAVAAGTMAKIEALTEGQYDVRVQLTNGVEYSSTIAIEDDPIGRFSRSTVFVISVLGADWFEKKEIIYGNSNAAAKLWSFGGDAFLVVRGVDVPFTRPPHTVKTDTGSAIRTMLTRVVVHPVQVISDFVARGDADEEVVRYAEGQIRGGRRDSDMVAAYMSACHQANLVMRCEASLRELGLPLPPALDPP